MTMILFIIGETNKALDRFHTKQSGALLIILPFDDKARLVSAEVGA